MRAATEKASPVAKDTICENPGDNCLDSQICVWYQLAIARSLMGTAKGDVGSIFGCLLGRLDARVEIAVETTSERRCAHQSIHGTLGLGPRKVRPARSPRCCSPQQRLGRL